MSPRMALACATCGMRPGPESAMSTLLLHFQVIHDTDDVALDLIAVCGCDATMTLARSEPAGPGRFLDHYACPACKRHGRILRREKA